MKDLDRAPRHLSCLAFQPQPKTPRATYVPDKERTRSSTQTDWRVILLIFKYIALRSDATLKNTGISVSASHYGLGLIAFDSTDKYSGEYAIRLHLIGSRIPSPTTASHNGFQHVMICQNPSHPPLSQNNPPLFLREAHYKSRTLGR